VRPCFPALFGHTGPYSSRPTATAINATFSAVFTATTFEPNLVPPQEAPRNGAHWRERTFSATQSVLEGGLPRATVVTAPSCDSEIPMSNRDLQPIAPDAAVQMYLNERDPELADKTLANIRNHLDHFTEWCEQEDITDTAELTGRKLHEYRLWRQEGIAQTTLSINLSSLRKFLRWCASIDAVPDGLDEKVVLPPRDREREARDTMLDADRAEEMLTYLRKFDYASRTHAVLELLWHCGCRKGTMRVFDVGDFHPRKQTLEARHRPEEDTPLKNGRRGERTIALNDRVTGVLRDYIEHHRLNQTDDYGREPLFTTRYGRISLSAIKDAAYTMTRPSVYGSCPHNRDPDDCTATTDTSASQCPSSVSPHPIRRGSITHHLLNEAPETVVSDRCDVSADVLNTTTISGRNTRRERLDDNTSRICCLLQSYPPA
jgi:site-specific recombinase XerD